MKKLLALLCLLPSLAFADTKISALTSTTTLNSVDIIPVVTNPSTTPANRVISKSNLSTTLDILTNASATSTYLTQSSATASYVTKSSATTTYCRSDGTNCVAGTGGGVTVPSTFTWTGVTVGTDLTVGGTSVIRSMSVLQSGSTFYTSSGTVVNFNTTGGAVKLGGTTVNLGDIGSQVFLPSLGAGGSGSFVVVDTVTAGNPLTGRNILAKDIPAGATNYIQNTSSLQSGSTFYISSGTINTKLSIASGFGGIAITPPQSSNGIETIDITTHTLKMIAPGFIDFIQMYPPGTNTATINGQITPLVVISSGNLSVRNGKLYFLDHTLGHAQSFTSSNTATTTNWVLPAADAAGCWQSDGAGNLSIVACSGGGGASGQINSASQNAVPRYSVTGSSNVLSGSTIATDNGSTFTITGVLVTSTLSVNSNNTLNLSFINPPDSLTYQFVGSSGPATTGHVAVFTASNTIADGGPIGGGSGDMVLASTQTSTGAKYFTSDSSVAVTATSTGLGTAFKANATNGSGTALWVTGGYVYLPTFGTNRILYADSGSNLGSSSNFQFFGTSATLSGLLNVSTLSINTGGVTPAAPIQVGPTNNSIDPQILIGRAVDDTLMGINGHGFVDSSVITRNGTIGYNSFDAIPTLFGGAPFDHYAGFQAGENYNSTGTINYIYDYLAQAGFNNTGTTPLHVDFYAGNPTVGSSGRPSTQIGFYVPGDPTAASSANWGFYSATHLNHMYGLSLGSQDDYYPTHQTPELLIGADKSDANIRFYEKDQNIWDIGASSGTSRFGIKDTNAIEYLSILTSGNVGVGSTNPVSKLNVSSGILTVDGSGGGVRLPLTSTLLAVDSTGLVVSTTVTGGSGVSLSSTNTWTAAQIFNSSVTISTNAVISSSGPVPALKIVGNGVNGTTNGTSGAFLMDCTGGGSGSGMCGQVYSNAGAQLSLDALWYIRAANTAWNEPLLYLSNANSSPQSTIRIDSGWPTITYIDTTLSSPSGKFQSSDHLGNFRVAEFRVAADNAFDSAIIVSSYVYAGDVAIGPGYNSATTTQLQVITSTINTNILTLSTSPTGVNFLAVSTVPATAPTDYLLKISSTSGTTVFGIQNNAHVISSGTTPSMGTCGSSPSVIGSDMAGVVTVGGGVVTSCTMNFASPFVNTPVCVESDNSTSVTADISSISSTSVTFGFSATLGGGTVQYICIGNKG